jgi:hypothetical protein
MDEAWLAGLTLLGAWLPNKATFQKHSLDLVATMVFCAAMGS